MNYVIKRVSQLDPGDYLPGIGIVTIIEQKALMEDSYFVAFHKEPTVWYPYQTDTRMLVGIPDRPIPELSNGPLLIGVNYE